MQLQTKLALAALTVFLGSCNAYQFLWGLNQEMNALCPNQKGASEVGVLDPCDINNFIMCFDGQAIAINTCAANGRFNREKNACDFIDQVAAPTNCKQITQPSNKTCGEPGVMVAAMKDSCKFYYSCTTAGAQKMQCNHLSFFIEEEGRCMFITEGFRSSIPRAALDDCEAKDPYTDAEIAQQ
ncbi:hypothetical protein EGW08_004345 [Elysia chlorotica]|uniref:Chitin-binding type-2 domain-containing protein n=1 Tax=Elysia chlorotica TaxID=188477 RepID=A0A3S1HX58_ELYCH|nr:hypothetical protein EGW08_004345 [Elysia chlorotica]